jgi:hypothetical protein
MPSAFISYSHDSPEQMTEVFGLCTRLRNEGVDCALDRLEETPPEGWPGWMRKSIMAADFVLVICTQPLRERYEGEAEGGVGKGAKWEGAIILEAIYESEGHNTKYIPVLPLGSDSGQIPKFLTGTTYYDLGADGGYERLYRRLTDQPEVERAPLGEIVELPPKSVQWSSAEPPSAEATTICFLDDLVPNDADIYEATRAVAEGRPVAIRWPSLNDELFERFSARRPDLRRQLAERGVEEGLEMAGSIESFDIALNSASRKRDSAAERIPLMWAGMAEAEFFGSLAESRFRVALKGFLVLVNAYTLSSLGTVQFDEDYRELPWGFRPGETSSSLFQHPAIAEALSSEPPFWAADTSFAGASFYVYAPKATTIAAYRKGAASAGAYLERFLIPQMELQLLESDRTITYEPTAITIHKVRDEDFKEVDYPEITE